MCIRDSNEQHESHGSLQNPDRPASAANDRVLQHPQLEAVVCWAERAVRGHMVSSAGMIAPVSEKGAQLCLCQLRGDTVFQSRNHVEDMGPALAGHVRV